VSSDTNIKFLKGTKIKLLIGQRIIVSINPRIKFFRINMFVFIFKEREDVG